MRAALAANLMTLMVVCVLPGARGDFIPADDRPPDLAAAGIRVTGDVVVAEIACVAGDFCRAGRWARLEMRVEAEGSPWRLLWSRRLPEIRLHESLPIAWRIATPLKARTAFRLTIDRGDPNPGNDALTRSFGPVAVRADHARIVPGPFKSKSKLNPEAKGKLFP